VPFAKSPFKPSRRLQPAELFSCPFTAEVVVGAGFDKPANSPYFTLRSPRVLKIGNRPSRHIIGFEEMQGMAERCRDVVRLWSSLWRRTNVRIGPNVNLRVEALPKPLRRCRGIDAGLPNIEVLKLIWKIGLLQEISQI
jgi:hypothetical protein